MEITGKIRLVDVTKEFGANGFKKRNLVVTTEEQYPQHISIEFVQDKVGLLDNLKQGDDVKVSINLRGREWVNPQGETVYFNTIQGWRVEKIGTDASKAQAPAMPPITPEQAFAPVQNLNEDDHDDLPF